MGVSRRSGAGRSDRMSARPHVTAVHDRIPWIQMLAYGLGGFVPIALFNSVGQLSGLIVNVGLGVSAILVGVAQMVPRLWDAITDPIMGHISDNTRTRFGRRRPYILFGGFLVAATFVAMWAVPREWAAGPQFWYFLVMSLLFYTAVTVFEIPHGALGMEMTADYHERTRLFSAKSFVGNLGAMITPWFYAMANTLRFRGRGDEVDGMRNVGYLAAGIVIVFAVTCALLCKERQIERVAGQQRIPLWTQLRMTVRNRTFLMLVAIVFATVLGFNLVNNFSNYITIFYLFGGDKENASKLMGWLGTTWGVTAVVAVFPLNWASSRIGKTRTLMLAVGLMLGAQASKVVCYNPHAPWLLFIPTAMLSGGMLMFFTLASAMIADVCDEDELNTGMRSEGSFYAVFWWFMKMGMAGAYFVAGVLIATTGFREKVDVQTPYTLLMLRVFEIGIPIALGLVSLALIRKYPLSEARAYEVKRELERRVMRCPQCGYDLRGSEQGTICPECGEPALGPQVRGDDSPP
ncbi:MAG: MFS transporter [Leptolyngbya sp. PLA3]|nr:MFS transporter [Leptolyngbya sp. PL-A3]